MGEVSETMAKKKKKGRPSLIDLQKRALKQQQLQQQQQKKQDEQEVEHRSGFKNPNLLNLGSTPGCRSTRRNPNLNGVSTNSALIDDDGDDERREKKHKLLHGLNSYTHRHSPNSQSGGSDLNPNEASENPEDSVKRRKIGGVVHGSEDTGVKFSKATDIAQGSPMDSGPTTPLPDKKLLVFILDRLQKKDTYGVFAEPVDPEELPDYHEIIANPMDFSTLRKKLDSGVYTNLEQFERDVFLICTNAMEYNPPETIYFRQARAMHEMAKKDFENLRRDSDDEEPQPKVVKRGRPPSKSLKKQLETHFVDCTPTEISADATLDTGGDSSKLSGAYNLRKAPSTYRFRPADTPVRTSHTSETQSSWSIDWENEFPSSVVRAVNKYGMKHFNVDENRRDTYNQLLSSLREPSVMATLEDELKQLIPVGLNTEYGYARSLARYAATLGPVAWKIASRRIGSVLPPGIKFGPGWVGEDTAPENPQQQVLFSGKQKWLNNSASDDHSSRLLSPTTSVSNSFTGNREETGLVPAQTLNSETKTFVANSLNHMNPSSSSNSQTHQSGPLINPERNGVIPGFSSHNHSNHMVGMVTNLTEPNSTQQGSSLCNNKQDMHHFGPDLNARFTSPNSPGSNVQMVLSQQPDLALQL